MSIILESVPRERLTQAVESGPLHYRGIMCVVRDAEIILCIVPQHVGSFLPPHNRPSIVIIGDDLQTARGPSVLIETRPEHEADWHDSVKATNPGISIIIATVESQGGVH